MTTKLRIGLLRLTDGAPVITAHEFGFFAEESIETELVVEPSWANIADKLAYGFIDAAVMLPPLALAAELGLRGKRQPLIIPYIVSANGNTITLTTSLVEEVKGLAARQNISTVAALAACLRARQTTLGVVHTYSTHNLLLRYFLATAGAEAERDVRLAVIPPASAVEALISGQIAGFCAGAPWAEVARRAKVGAAIATSCDIWKSAPEKAFAVSAHWANEHDAALAGAIRAMLRAAKFCDDPKNASYVAALLSRRRYLDVDAHVILANLPGGSAGGAKCGFFSGAVTFPWRSQGMWFLKETRRWGLMDKDSDARELVTRVYRPDLYRAALAPLGEPVPIGDWKREGAHDQEWSLEAAPAAIAMPPDSFCDGAIFDPSEVWGGTEAAKMGALHK
ncbi:MAG TPA: CmpA/NrtA family ABC transporter substrate-binding protein [Methylocella sp.]|nr:CmpA/NrtA family ABC transporter substrate-binding protein [Methylocella sp.]